MAKVKLIDMGVIELMRGLVDFYCYKNDIWIARSWPKKLAPPYSDLQKIYMDIFRLSKQVHFYFSDAVLEAWRISSGQSLPQWQDQIPAIFMQYYKFYSILVPVVVDFEVEYGEGKRRVNFLVWSGYDFSFSGGSSVWRVSDWFSDEYINSFEGKLLFTLYDEIGLRVCCPWILLSV